MINKQKYLASLPIVAVLAIFGVVDGALADDGQVPSDAAYLDGGDSRVGVILLHGRGKHPRWKVVEPLRTGIHRQLGFHTLSLQMPVSRRGDCQEGAAQPKHCWRQYAALFSDAGRRIDDAVTFLRRRRNVSEIYLLGHSMGARMGAAYLAGLTGAEKAGAIEGFVGVGMRHRGGRPLDTLESLRQLTGLRVLDIYGEGGTGRDAADAAVRRASGLTNRPDYRQIPVEGADHRFSNRENGRPFSERLVSEVVNWLQMQIPPNAGR